MNVKLKLKHFLHLSKYSHWFSFIWFCSMKKHYNISKSTIVIWKLLIEKCCCFALTSIMVQFVIVAMIINSPGDNTYQKRYTSNPISKSMFFFFLHSLGIEFFCSATDPLCLFELMHLLLKPKNQLNFHNKILKSIIYLYVFNVVVVWLNIYFFCFGGHFHAVQISKAISIETCNVECTMQNWMCLFGPWQYPYL